jgi:3-oxoacyl-[acyl-carrier protein] reductase
MSSTLLVTGGGRGIGRAVALRFAREQWNVAVLSRTRSEVEECCASVERAGGRALPCVADVTSEKDVESAVAATLAKFGAIDVLVNDAGVFKVVPLAAMETATWRAIVDTNLTGVFLVTRAVVRSMVELERGRAIVNVSSEAGKKGFAGSTAYCASKYGLCGFGDALREELRPLGIRVVNVLPGQVDTKVWDGCGLDLEKLGIRRDRMMRPEAIADAIAHAVLAEGAVAEEIQLRPM